MKRIAIVQSNYIPWKGYFDLIASVDEFVLYDDMQFTRRDWRNRNLIKTPSGTTWLTIPVKVKGRYHQKINETEVLSLEWAADHWKSVELNYRRAPWFEAEANAIRQMYDRATMPFLSDVNRHFLSGLCLRLGISTKLSDSREFELQEDRSDRLASICEQAGASVYVSGPAARDYLDEAPFAARNIRVDWFDYSGYPPYQQLWGPFEHGVSVLDLLFNAGPMVRDYLKVRK